MKKSAKKSWLVSLLVGIIVVPATIAFGTFTAKPTNVVTVVPETHYVAQDIDIECVLKQNPEVYSVVNVYRQNAANIEYR